MQNNSAFWGNSCNASRWAQPFEVTLSLAKEKFASDGVRDAYIATPLSGLSPEKYVLKKAQEQQVNEIEKLFTSTEEHTRKSGLNECTSQKLFFDIM